jgi:alkylation response protein AidB-like acyl-CoA dehydrogenase
MKVCEIAMDILANHSIYHKNFVEKHFRDARLTQIYEGTNQINRLAIIEDQMEELFK